MIKGIFQKFQKDPVHPNDRYVLKTQTLASFGFDIPLFQRGGLIGWLGFQLNRFYLNPGTSTSVSAPVFSEISSDRIWGTASWQRGPGGSGGRKLNCRASLMEALRFSSTVLKQSYIQVCASPEDALYLGRGKSTLTLSKLLLEKFRECWFAFFQGFSIELHKNFPSVS